MVLIGNGRIRDNYFDFKSFRPLAGIMVLIGELGGINASYIR